MTIREMNGRTYRLRNDGELDKRYKFAKQVDARERVMEKVRQSAKRNRARAANNRARERAITVTKAIWVLVLIFALIHLVLR